MSETINTDENDYFTDIIIDCFAVGTIPIFWGTPNIKNYFNMDGVIVMDSLKDVNDIVKNCNEEDYKKRLPAIKENMELAKNYISTYDWIYNNINFKELI